ncbi:MAG: tetratricopeptide repeat protein [Gammaproteobacteria bacterium]|nr:tetratricopeptide repeat protein [Gammaproteobacteria bacterium]
MKLIRYILSHLLLIAFLFLLVLAYYYRSQLFPAEVVSRIDHVTQRVMFWRKPARVEPMQTETTAVPTSPVEQQTPPPLAAAPQQPVAVPESMDQTPPTPPPMQEPVPGMPAEQAQAPAPEPTPTQEEASPVTDQGPAPEGNAQMEAPSVSALDQAREHYSQGDIEGAIERYQQLTQPDEANPNVFGELGNIYYAQGKWQEAGMAYYEAATRLLKLGDIAQVQYLYRVIQGLDQDSADKLRQQLDNGGNP